MHVKRLGVAVVLASAIAAASGCTNAAHGIAALDREPTAEDRLPAIIVTEGVDPDSIRKVAEQEQVAYFIGETGDGQGYCAYAVKESEFVGGCGSGRGQLVTVSPGGASELPQLTLVMDSHDAENLRRDGWSEVHDNILIR